MSLIWLEIVLGFGVPILWGLWELWSLRQLRQRDEALNLDPAVDRSPPHESAERVEGS